MKKFLILCMLTSTIAFAQKQPTGVTYDTKIIKVDDGDTVTIAANFLPKPLKPELKVRIYGVDTPEKGSRAKCEKENIRGQAASQYTIQLVKSTTKHQVIIYDWDKFGGRVLGDIILDGRSLRNQLILNNYARPYYGEAKQSWCN